MFFQSLNFYSPHRYLGPCLYCLSIFYWHFQTVLDFEQVLLRPFYHFILFFFLSYVFLPSIGSGGYFFPHLPFQPVYRNREGSWTSTVQMWETLLNGYLFKSLALLAHPVDTCIKNFHLNCIQCYTIHVYNIHCIGRCIPELPRARKPISIQIRNYLDTKRFRWSYPSGVPNKVFHQKTIL